MTHLHYQLIWAAEITALVLAVAFALWRGDRPARLIAAIYVVGNAATMFLFPARLAELAADAVGCAAMCAVAVRWPRTWLLWACGFQLVSTATRVAALLDTSIRPLAYATALNTWWMLEVAALVWGTVEVVRRADGGRRSLEPAT